MEIIFNMPFVTLNEYIAADKANRYKGGAIKKQQTNSVAYLALEQGVKPISKKVDIDFHWYKPNNRTDHDNIAFCKKFILDGLVVAGILKNDSHKYIGNFTDTFELDKTRSYISCKIKINL